MKSFGFTFIELLITLAITAILATLSIPTVADLYQKTEWSHTLHAIENMIHQTRQLAITTGKEAFLCPYETTARQCGQNWQQGLSLFQGEIATLHHAPFPNHLMVTFTAFGSAKRITFDQMGFTQQNGHFTLEQTRSHCHYLAFIYLRKSGHTHTTTEVHCE